MDDIQLIQELGIENFSPQDQQRVIEELNMQVGEALSAKLSEEQLDEYQHIIDNDEELINTWLAKNTPDYKQSALFQELAKDESEATPEKMYASVAWLQVNNPGFETVVAEIKAKIKQDPESYK